MLIQGVEFFTFIWNDSKEKARLASKKSGERIKFKWLDENDKDTEYYFELRIMEDEITKDVSLVVTDFSVEDELEVIQVIVGKSNFRFKTCYRICLIKL